MRKKYLAELTGYVLWTNNIVISWLDQVDDEQWEREVPSSFNSIKNTTLHIVSAEKIWAGFWRNTPNPVFLSAGFKGDKDELIGIWKATSADLKNLIEGFSEEKYSEQISFNFRREEWRMEFLQTFLHFINHSTYHRGQLVTLLRQVGFKDLSSTDMAVYFRG